jgi:hypothetical protein
MIDVRGVRLVLGEGVGERLVVVVCEPFVEMIGEVVGKRVGRGVFKVDDNQGVVGRSRWWSRLVEDEEVPVF